jgi:serine/threonine protein phosphatase 1
MATYVIGDIHGRDDAIEDVLHGCEFKYYEDTLIPLGDVCDGGRGTRKCFDILSEVQNLVLILGNHDQWSLNWMKTGRELPIWTHQGGYATMESYGFDRRNVPKKHIEMLENAKVYYVDDKNRIFVHGGFDPNVKIEYQDPELLMWDRDLIWYARGYTEELNGRRVTVPGKNVPGYARVFVGHTTTQIHTEVSDLVNDPQADPYKPKFFNNLVMLDTGAGWNGKLTIMDVDTLEYWQSELQVPNI